MLSTEEVKANLNKAKKALFKYYKDNGLDPSIDFSKDPIHGEMVTNLIIRLNRERDKLLRILPIWKMKNILTNIRKKNMAKKIKEEKKAKAAPAPEAKPKKKVNKEEKPSKDKKKKKKVHKEED